MDLPIDGLDGQMVGQDCQDKVEADMTAGREALSWMKRQERIGRWQEETGGRQAGGDRGWQEETGDHQEAVFKIKGHQGDQAASDLR